MSSALIPVMWYRVLSAWGCRCGRFYPFGSNSYIVNFSQWSRIICSVICNLSIKMSCILQTVCCGFPVCLCFGSKTISGLLVGLCWSHPTGYFICCQAPRGSGNSTVRFLHSNLPLYWSSYIYDTAHGWSSHGSRHYRQHHPARRL